MANTPNLDLVKPAGTDKALVSVINSNSDKIDAGFGSLSDQIAKQAISVSFDSAFSSVTNKQINAVRVADVVNCGGYISGTSITEGATIITGLPAPFSNNIRIPVRIQDSKVGTLFYNGSNWVYSGDTTGLLNFNLCYIKA